MKIQWSVFLSFFLLFALAGCGGEEFGSTPQTAKSEADTLKNYSHSSCSTYTLIKPKVDVLYVVDNSSSTYYLSSDVKKALSNTVNSLSRDFDFRVIGTPLLATSSNVSSANENYQVMTNSTGDGLAGIPTDSRRITSAGSFSFFNNAPVSGVERGTQRVVEFINHHQNGLIRPNSYLIIVLVSNGRDQDLETDQGFGNGSTEPNNSNFIARHASFTNIRNTLNPIQLRFMAVTAQTHNCKPGYWTSNHSYVRMAKQLYQDSQANDNDSKQDAFDLCQAQNITSIFTSINNSIKQVVLKHEYSHWPITFAENNEMVDLDEIRVHKVSSNGTSVELTRGIQWNYDGNPATSVVRTVNTRSGPLPRPGVGEPVTGRHFIAFNSPIIYPDCVLVTSVSRTEYFDHVVLPQNPQVNTLALRINGRLIPKSDTNGWSYPSAAPQTINIKAPYPTPADENPPVMRTGFMIKLNGSDNYYKSGDSVQADYIPQGI